MMAKPASVKMIKIVLHKKEMRQKARGGRATQGLLNIKYVRVSRAGDFNAEH
jgi:hypothetical protein